MLQGSCIPVCMLMVGCWLPTWKRDMTRIQRDVHGELGGANDWWHVQLAATHSAVAPSVQQPRQAHNYGRYRRDPGQRELS